MKVFISWSGARSRMVADALNDWLKRVIQAVKPFYSPEIDKGAKWSSEIDDALEGTHFGIVCLTPDNLNSTWIHYETGALSKTKDALVWTFLHGLTPGDVPPPLGKFQNTVAEKEDVLRLLKTINGRLGEVGSEPLQDRLLEDNFELFWPRLEERLQAAEKIPASTISERVNDAIEGQRNERAILDEILELVRSQERRLLSVEEHLYAPQQQTHIKQKRKLPQWSYYHSIYIPISASVPNAADIAQQFRNIFLQSIPAATALIENSNDGLLVHLEFDPPVRSDTAQSLLNLAKHQTSYNLLQGWSGRVSDSPE